MEKIPRYFVEDAGYDEYEDGIWCISEDVAELEAENARLNILMKEEKQRYIDIVDDQQKNIDEYVDTITRLKALLCVACRFNQKCSTQKENPFMCDSWEIK